MAVMEKASSDKNTEDSTGGRSGEERKKGRMKRRREGTVMFKFG